MPTIAKRTAERIFPVPEVELVRDGKGSDKFALHFKKSDLSLDLSVRERARDFLEKLAKTASDFVKADKISTVILPSDLGGQGRKQFIRLAAKKFPNATFPDTYLPAAGVDLSAPGLAAMPESTRP